SPHAHLEELRPVLAGDEKAVARGIVSDAVEHIDTAAAIIVGREQPRKGDEPEQPAGRRIDAGNGLRLPDVREEFAFHPFELVELRERQAMAKHADRARDLECRWVEKTNLVRAVAHDERAAVGGEAPAFAGVGELALHLERLEPIDEALLVFPFELENLPAEHRYALAEILRRQPHLLKHAAGLQVDLAERGVALE